jgi:ribosomal protein L44E
MMEHFTRNTESITKFCRTCGRLTQHRVNNGRTGACLEHDAPKMTKAQQKKKAAAAIAAKNPPLFPMDEV